MKKTLVIGATTKEDRYAYKAVQSLLAHHHEVIAYGVRSGKIQNIEIETEWNPNWHVDTVTLYINPERQKEYEAKILALKPQRVIFNPGTENESFVKQLLANGIHPEVACTLVLLSIGNY